MIASRCSEERSEQAAAKVLTCEVHHSGHEGEAIGATFDLEHEREPVLNGQVQVGLPVLEKD